MEEESAGGMHCDLCQLCERVASSESIEILLDNLTRGCTSALGASGAIVRLLDERHETLKLAAAAGAAGRGAGEPVMQLGDSPLDRSAIEGHLVEQKGSGRSEPSTIAVPLCLKERCVGVMHVYGEPGHAFSPEEKTIASTLASHAGIVLERLRAYRQIRVLQDVAQAINSSLEETRVLETVVRQAAEVLDFKGASLRVLDEDGRQLEPRAAYGLSPGYLKKGPVLLEKSPLDQEVLSGKAVSLRDEEMAGKIQYPEELRREGVRAVLCLPLAIKGKPVGVLRVYSSVPYTFTASDIDFLRSLANHGAIAIENARLFEHLRRDYADLRRAVWKWYDWGESPPRM